MVGKRVTLGTGGPEVGTIRDPRFFPQTNMITYKVVFDEDATLPDDLGARLRVGFSPFSISMRLL